MIVIATIGCGRQQNNLKILLPLHENIHVLNIVVLIH